MHSSCNLIKSSNTSVKGDIEIVTECVVTEEEQHFQEIENNQIKSYEVIGASILDKARKDSDHIIMEAFQYSKNIEKEAYEKGYAPVSYTHLDVYKRQVILMTQLRIQSSMVISF